MNSKWILVIVLGCAAVSALPARQHNLKQRQRLTPVKDLSIGGHVATKGDFPFQVSLQRKTNYSPWKHYCGGSIISHHTVLTAAHCTTRYTLPTTRIVAGEYDFTLEEGTEQIRYVDRVIAHPDYNGSKDFRPFDIAILRVMTPFEFNKDVKNIKIAYLGHNHKGTATLSGWGQVTRSSYLETVSDVLRTEDLPLLTYSQCKSALQSTGDTMMPDNVICVGPLNGEKGPCYGDSGGPLVQNGVLIGIASFVTYGCANLGSPSGFTRVSSYTDWILQEDRNIRRYIWPPLTTPKTTTAKYYASGDGSDDYDGLY